MISNFYSILNCKRFERDSFNADNHSDSSGHTPTHQSSSKAPLSSELDGEELSRRLHQDDSDVESTPYGDESLRHCSPRYGSGDVTSCSRSRTTGQHHRQQRHPHQLQSQQPGADGGRQQAATPAAGGGVQSSSVYQVSPSTKSVDILSASAISDNLRLASAGGAASTAAAVDDFRRAMQQHNSFSQSLFHQAHVYRPA